MKTRTWLLLLGAAALVLAVAAVWSLRGQPAARYAEVLLDGTVVKTVDLAEDQRFTVQCGEGYNVIAVADGAISVCEADCEGNDCVHTGAKSSGLPIICLPHRLVIRFTDKQGLDGLSS